MKVLGRDPTRSIYHGRTYADFMRPKNDWDSKNCGYKTSKTIPINKMEICTCHKIVAVYKDFWDDKIEMESYKKEWCIYGLAHPN